MFVFALVNISNISPFISNGKSEVLPQFHMELCRFQMFKWHFFHTKCVRMLKTKDLPANPAFRNPKK